MSKPCEYCGCSPCDCDWGMEHVSEREIQELLNFAKNDERFGVAFRGALSQVRHKVHLEKLGYDVKVAQSDNQGAPDFIIEGKTVEHKRARNELYSNGSIKVELQKSRGKVPTRLYDDGFADFISVDVSHHTGKSNDYRYIKTNRLRKHQKYKNKIASMQEVDNSWYSDPKTILRN